MQKDPFVSIIVPAYNYANFILETLQSIQEQTYVNWEAIIVDDGSTDDTRQVVKTIVETDSRIKYIYQTNKGLPAARNTGIEASLGNYIQFLDADDLLSKSKIELQVKYMLENLSSDISYTTAHYFKHPDMNMLYADINLGMVAWIPKINGSGNMVLECAFGGATFNFFEDVNAYALVRIHSSSMSRKKNSMLKWEIHARTLLTTYINNSSISELLKYNLIKQNQIFIKSLKKEFISQFALLNLKVLKAVYNEYGSWGFLSIYISSINRRIKHHIKSK